MNDLTKNLLLWVVVAVVLMVVFQSFSPKGGATATGGPITYSEFLREVESGRVASVKFTNESNLATNAIAFKRKDSSTGTVYGPQDDKLVDTLLDKNVTIDREQPESGISLVAILLNFLPVLLIIGFWIFIMRQMQGGGGGAKGAMSFGKSRAKLQGEDQVKVTFADVAGCDEAKEEVGELVEFLRDPGKFQKLGGKIPRGVLMVGQPGTGKTLLAKAIAGEAKVPFFSISGSDFVEMFVGVGASRVRDMFEQAKKHAPCIIFIDEIDAVGRHRGAGLGGGHDEREQTLNQLLVEMDGFEGNDGVIIIAATNRPDVLDPALLRPGRFDRQVVVPVPDIKGREMILDIYGKKTKLAADVDMAVIARGTPGFSGADLENLVNEAALLAARENKDEVDASLLERAKDKVMMGAERRSMIISDKEKEITAYHEAGHALVARLLPGADPIHKVTIIPRGRALGLTMQLPVDEKYTHARGYLLDRIAILFGGRVAEQLVFNEITTGAGNDIERASELARKMVCEWGMSDELGPLAYGKKEEHIFLGREIAQHRDYSEQTAQRIDAAVKQIIVEANDKVTRLLEENRDILKAIAAELLERETIVLEDIDTIIAQRRGGEGQKPDGETVAAAEVDPATATAEADETAAA